MPAITAPIRSRGPRNAADSPVNPRHARIASQVVRAAAAANVRPAPRTRPRGPAGSCRASGRSARCQSIATGPAGRRSRRPERRCGRRGRCCGRAPATTASSRSRGPSAAARQPAGEDRGRRGRRPPGPPRRRRRGRPPGAAPEWQLHPAQHGQVGSVEAAEHRDQQPAVAGLGQPARCDPALRGRGCDDGQRLEQRAGVEARRPGSARRCRVLAGGGDQPHREPALAQVDGDRGGRGDRRTPATSASPLPTVRAGPGCRGTGWRATARAAPRGAPSARRRAPSCASARGAGRRRGGTRARVTSSALPVANARGPVVAGPGPLAAERDRGQR